MSPSRCRKRQALDLALDLSKTRWLLCLVLRRTTGLRNGVFAQRPQADGGNGMQQPRKRAGTPEGIRTPGLLLRRQLLYPAELLAHVSRRCLQTIGYDIVRIFFSFVKGDFTFLFLVSPRVVWLIIPAKPPQRWVAKRKNQKGRISRRGRPFAFFRLPWVTPFPASPD